MKKLIPLLIIGFLGAFACQKETERPISRMQYLIHAPSGGNVTLYHNRSGKMITQQFDEYIQLNDHVRPGDSIKLRVHAPGMITVEVFRDFESIQFIQHPSRVSIHRRANQ